MGPTSDVLEPNLAVTCEVRPHRPAPSYSIRVSQVDGGTRLRYGVKIAPEDATVSPTHSAHLDTLMYQTAAARAGANICFLVSRAYTIRSSLFMAAPTASFFFSGWAATERVVSRVTYWLMLAL